MRFGEKLKKARTQCGFSQLYLAEKIGVSRSTIINYEKCKYTPNVALIERLSAALDVSMQDLV